MAGELEKQTNLAKVLFAKAEAKLNTSELTHTPAQPPDAYLVDGKAVRNLVRAYAILFLWIEEGRYGRKPKEYDLRKAALEVCLSCGLYPQDVSEDDEYEPCGLVTRRRVGDL